MQVSVHMRGGFAGDATVLDVDTARLPRQRAAELESALANVGFFGLSDVSGQGIGADQGQIELRVVDGSRSHRVSFPNDGSPGAQPLNELVQHLRHIAAGAEGGS